ncbi:DUF4221 family protein [Pleomorphovibrio marinus]|uniref:DUF4221 family protein n=1 Tax=Pleomorphovibrio marinus TaxID=2164132 RepID=UPI000E0B6995|nr:DUF4221 family protein [Pleomorphovibrio marinus]
MISFPLIKAGISFTQFFILLQIALLVACGRNSNSSVEVSDNLVISVDTVMVDSRNDILYVQENLLKSDVDTKVQFLYNFNRPKHGIEKINLDKLEFEEMISFEKEGPNSIEPFFSKLAIAEEGEIVICFHTQAKIFDPNLKLSREVNFDQLVDNKISDSGALLASLLNYPREKDRFIGLFNNWENSSYFILDMDDLNKRHKLIELPDLDKLADFNVDILYNGSWGGRLTSQVRADQNRDKILITNNTFNEILVYDLVLDSLIHKTWESELIGSKRAAVPIKKVEGDSDQLFELDRQIKEDIHFGNLVWNPDREQYYRFSFKEKFEGEREPHNYYQPLGAEVFLSVFDADLRLIGESEIPALKIRPKKHFFKDGSIWFFENFEDELGFIRVTVE